MVTRVSMAGLVLIVIGLLIVIVHALDMSNHFSVEAMLPSLGLILVGIAVQLLGLGVILVSKNNTYSKHTPS
jgi:hypothetical protein